MSVPPVSLSVLRKTPATSTAGMYKIRDGTTKESPFESSRSEDDEGSKVAARALGCCASLSSAIDDKIAIICANAELIETNATK